MDVQIHADRIGGQLTITVTGPIDPQAAAELTEAFDVFQATSFHRVILDLSRSTTCSDAAIAAVVTANRNITAAGGQLDLIDPRPATVPTTTPIGRRRSAADVAALTPRLQPTTLQGRAARAVPG